jgi:N-acetylmuramoyl-L-alanine amidase
MLRKSTKYIVIHCSATRASMDVGAKEIRQWHKAKGWSEIGYHFVIRRNGVVEKGRGIDQVGSHVKGYNANSIGICMAGGISNNSLQPENNFTAAQWVSLKATLSMLVKKYPAAKVLGHRDFPKVAKACPCFDAKPWATKNGFKAA